jgi:type I restriction enzyme S subunit
MKYIDLGQLVKIQKGKKLEEVYVKSADTLRYIQIEDLRNDGNIKYTSDIKSVLCDIKDILIAWDGANAGTIGFGLEGAIGSTLAKLTPVKEYFTPFVGRFLQSKSKYLRGSCTGATIPHISKLALTKIQIPLPPLPEQKRIAAILEKADALRQKNKQLLAAYDELLQATFLDMFGDPVTNPKGWKKKTLSDVSEVVSGVTKGRKIDKEKVVILPYIRVANVQDGHLVLNEIKAIEALPSDLEKYRLLPGDILLTEGGDPDKLGRGAVWRGEIEDCIHQNHIFRVRISDKNLKEAYLSALIGSSYGKSYFLKAAKQTTGIASINATQLRNFPVIMAPFQLQEKFEIAIANIEVQKAILKQSIQDSEDLFNGLVQKAFNGELN